MSVEFEPLSHRWQQDPYPKYRELRDHAPVHYSPESDAWSVSRYEDVQTVLKTSELFASRRPGPRELAKGAPGWLELMRLALRFAIRFRTAPWKLNRSRMLISENGEAHMLMRNIVNRGFTPRRVLSWEKRVRELAAEGLARVRAEREFDLVTAFAVPLPVTVISEILGVDGAHRDDFKRWSDAVIQGTGSEMGRIDGPAMDAMTELFAYLRPVVRARRREPTDDLISVLVTHQGEAQLSDLEVLMFVFLLLLAGNETTTNLLGNAVDALLEHPDQLAKVIQDPERVPGLIEETLRWDSPVQMVSRRATRDLELRGIRIPEDAQVVVLLGSANRDERRFPDPDRFDVTRDSRGHLSFGFGAHFCLGAALARLEAKAALEALLPELPGLERVRPEREFLDSYVVRGRTRLELRPAA
ncbi:MAG: cytochrome P450 [Myxococcales bacterium]|nr:cytochrome P450 [Myxococcales bacterium]